MAGFNATFYPTISGIAKEALIAELPSFEMFSIGLDAGEKSTGEKVTVNVYGDPGATAAFDKVNNNYGNGDAPDMDRKEVTLDRHYKKTKAITDVHMTNGLELKKLISGMVRRAIKDVKLDALTLITAANFPTVAHTGAASTLTADIAAKLASENATAAGWDEADLKMGLVSTYYTSLLQDDDLKTASPEDQTQRRSGKVRLLSGWDAFNIPGLATNDNNLTGFITDASGIALGFAVKKSAPSVRENLAMFEVIRVPGAPVISLRGIVNPYTDEFLLTVECLSGKAVARAEGLQRIRSAA